MQKIITIENGVCRMPQWRMAHPVCFELADGEHIAIVGPNGSGKSMLVDIITGAHALMPLAPAKYDFAPSKAKMVSDNIKYISFRDTYGTNDSNYYYQQRWNQHDIDDTPIVADLLDEAYRIAEEGLCRKTPIDKFIVSSETPEQRDERLRQEAAYREEMHRDLQKIREKLYSMFNIEALLDKHIVLLSSGELRKFYLTKALLSNPRVLIMDNPFIGLDVTARQQLRDFLQLLVRETHISIILVTPKSDDLPDFITHVYEVKGLSVSKKQALSEYLSSADTNIGRQLTDEKKLAISQLQDNEQDNLPENVIEFRNVNIRYGERTILKDLNLSIRKGEHWALSGENGAGKSTLLSIVCADNPQSYANDIVLFGHQRGKGESIWDIKKHIGYISPEMHRAYQRDIPALRIVASGLSDMNGLYLATKPEHVQKCLFWMDVFGIKDLAERTFLKLSSGEQRLVLLARAFVKDPALLILDEPLHGLDQHNSQLVKEIIEAFCTRRDKTLIMVTHYQEELPPCIDHSIRLKRIV